MPVEARGDSSPGAGGPGGSQPGCWELRQTGNLELEVG